MTEFEFINAMSDKHHIAVIGDALMAHAKRQHYLAVEEAQVRQIQREAAREYRKVRCEKRLNTVLLIASMIGIAVATWFLTSVGAN